MNQEGSLMNKLSQEAWSTDFDRDFQAMARKRGQPTDDSALPTELPAALSETKPATLIPAQSYDSFDYLPPASGGAEN